MFKLPVSGFDVTVRQPAGADDLVLADARSIDLALALIVIGRLATKADASPVDAAALAITDIETILLLIRSAVFGGLIGADVLCQNRDCGAKADISFRISDYVAHHPVRMRADTERDEHAGWYRLRDLGVRFRVPCGEDLVAVSGASLPDRELLRRCVTPAEVDAPTRRKVERSMESLAPSLSHEIQGSCPECGKKLTVFFDVTQFVLRGLKDQASYVYEDVHLLALNYHWPEAKILDLPRNRRMQYAEMLREQGGL
jgi:hypothetical protein